MTEWVVLVVTLLRAWQPVANAALSSLAGVSTVVRCLDRFYVTLTRSVPLHLLVWPVRVLLALGFLPSGLTKLLGHRFTQLPATDPVGGLFDHLEAMGGLYTMIGICQVLAAVLLLVPATSLLGALIYLPVIASIVVITWTLPFGNTRFMTAAMLLGTTFLLAWDWPRLRSILLPHANAPARSRWRNTR